jgi:site-specific recombinase XerD
MVNELLTVKKTDIQQSLEDLVNMETTISDSLIHMKEHRYWAQSTFESYKNDVKTFEEFLMDNNLDPVLKNGERLAIVNQWIKHQKENGVAFKTISRRIASLSSIYGFYQSLGIVHSNPFKAVRVPGPHSGSYSAVMDMDQLKQVYVAIQDLKKEGVDIEIPIKLLMFTGLRNQALCSLKVRDVEFDEELIVYNSGVYNSKHKVQFLPLPPKFLNSLREYIKENGLTSDDPLCYGIKGLALQNKQLNRMTDKICEYLGWEGERRVTPHGFRYSIATLLDEKGVSKDTIQYLLGHSETESIKFYLRRDKRKIYQIKKVLTEIENELEEHLTHVTHVTHAKAAVSDTHEQIQITHSHAEEFAQPKSLPFSEDFLMKLAVQNPEIFERIMSLHYQNQKKAT